MTINAEIIAIGDELISGDVVDTNSSYLSKELSYCGIKTKYHSSIGDGEGEIGKALNTSLNRSEIIIFTGGLGPTDDDITVKSIAKALNKELIFQEIIWENIKQTLIDANRDPDVYNKTQAYIPFGANYFLNYAGTAPALYIEHDNKKIFLLPGVPSEVKVFWQENLKPILQQLTSSHIAVRKLMYAGIAEAKINEILGNIALCDNPKIAFLPQSSEIIVKLTANASSEKEVKALLDDMENTIQSKIGDYFWGYQNDRIEHTIKDLLIDNKLKLSTAESCTGGLISKLLTDIAGSSDYITLNLVTYSNESKIKMLGVSEDTLSKYGAVSEQTAKEMAEGIRNLSANEIGLGITGVAGPSGSEKKPPGLVYVSFSSNENTVVHEMRFPKKLPREEIRQRAAKKSLHLLKDFILSNFTY